MENDKAYLECLLQDIETFSECPLNVLCFSITKEELDGEVLDCLKRYFDEKRSDRNFAVDSFLIRQSLKLFLKEELSSCVLDRQNKKEKNEKAYSGEAIAKKIFSCLKTSCKDMSTSFGNGSFVNKPFQRCRTSVCSVKNKRRKMEDRHIVYDDLNYLFNLESPVHQSFYGIFDGHGGTSAADYASSQLVKKLIDCSDLILDPGKSLKNAIMQTDESFCSKAKNERLGSGATVVTVLLQGDSMTVGWLGDSQVVLSKNKQAVQLMEPHKPNREDERERIEALGGCVVFFGGWRVNGTLAVSRAIGDLDQKPYVTGEPDIEEFVLEGDEEFLILACDGLWDTIEPVTAVEIVHKHILNNDHENAATALVEAAKNNFSMDNITVMVVYFDFNFKDVSNHHNNNNVEPTTNDDITDHT